MLKTILVLLVLSILFFLLFMLIINFILFIGSASCEYLIEMSNKKEKQPKIVSKKIIYFDSKGKKYEQELEDKTQCLIIANSGNVGSHIEGEAHIGTVYYYYDNHNNTSVSAH